MTPTLNTWASVESLAKWQLCKCWHDYDNTLLGEAYIAYTKAIIGYDATKGITFATYFANCMRRHIDNYLRYHSSVVHVPVASEYKLTMQSLDAPVTPDGLALTDIIAGEQESGDIDLADIKIPPKHIEAYTNAVEAANRGLTEREFLIEKYGDNYHSKQVQITNFRKFMQKYKLGYIGGDK